MKNEPVRSEIKEKFKGRERKQIQIPREEKEEERKKKKKGRGRKKHKRIKTTKTSLIKKDVTMIRNPICYDHRPLNSL
jgi:hypothetical protein